MNIEKMATKREITPVDSGYAWVVLLGCSSIYMILSGNVKAFGIIYNEFLHKYDVGAGNTAWVGSLQSFLYFATGALANHLAKKLSFRIVTMAGGVLMSFGFMISAFVPQIEWMYLTIGIISGFGGGLVYGPTTTLISFYFEKRRAFANGIVLSGSGIGSFVYPYFYRYIIDEFGLQGTMLIISAVILNICVAGALLRQPYQLINVDSDSQAKVESKQTCDPEISNNTVKTLRKKTPPIVDLSLLRIPHLSMYVISLTINVVAYAASFSVFPAHMDSIGLTGNEIAIALSMIGVTEIFARSFFGWFADLRIVQKRTIMICSTAASGTAAMIIPLMRNFPAMVVYGCVLGIFPGAFWSLMAVVMLDCVELERLTSAMGLLLMFLSLGNVIGQPSMGWIEDATGSWDLSFRVMGMCYYTSGVVLLLAPVFEKFWCCRPDTAGEIPQTVVPQEQVKMLTNDYEVVADTITTHTYAGDYKDIPMSETERDFRVNNGNGHAAKLAPIVSVNNL